MKYKILYIFFFIINLVLAHSGRTDSDGGHYNRSTGEYHYHNSSNGFLNIVFLGFIVFIILIVLSRKSKPKKQYNENKKNNFTYENKLEDTINYLQQKNSEKIDNNILYLLKLMNYDINRIKSLTTLKIVSNKFIPVLKYCTNLNSLTLNIECLKHDSTVELLNRLLKLQTLIIQMDQYDYLILPEKKIFNNIENIRIECNGITDIGNLKNFKRLKKLTLIPKNKISSTKSIESITNFLQLEELILDNNKIRNVKNLSNSNIRFLSLKNNKIKNIKELNGLLGIKSLEKIDITGNLIEVNDIKELMKILPNTKILY